LIIFASLSVFVFQTILDYPVALPDGIRFVRRSIGKRLLRVKHKMPAKAAGGGACRKGKE
jgi:hypothetical protein